MSDRRESIDLRTSPPPERHDDTVAEYFASPHAARLPPVERSLQAGSTDAAPPADPLRLIDLYLYGGEEQTPHPQTRDPCLATCRHLTNPQSTAPVDRCPLERRAKVRQESESGRAITIRGGGRLPGREWLVVRGQSVAIQPDVRYRPLWDAARERRPRHSGTGTAGSAVASIVARRRRSVSSWHASGGQRTGRPSSGTCTDAGGRQTPANSALSTPANENG